jgi:hypothetical protein
MNVTIFADYAGQPDDEAQSSQTYITVLCNKKEYSDVNNKCEVLRKSLERYGVDINNPKFEFHTSDIFWGKGFMKPLSVTKRFEVADKLKQIIKGSNLRYVLVKIDKPEGILSLDIFAEEVKRTVDKELAKFPKNDIDNLDSQVLKKVGDKDLGRMATCYHLLLGATSGLLHWGGYRKYANLVVDNQFAEPLILLNFILDFGKFTWPMIRDTIDFSKWPHGGKPDWHLSGNAVEKESYSEYGIQLADYLAYTFKRIGKDLFDANRFCLTTNLTEFKDSPGIYFKVAGYTKSMLRPYYPKLHKKSNNPYFHYESKYQAAGE